MRLPSCRCAPGNCCRRDHRSSEGFFVDRGPCGPEHASPRYRLGVRSEGEHIRHEVDSYEAFERLEVSPRR